MKIGILTYRQTPFISANTAIGYTLGETLKNEYGYDVIFIGYKQDEAQDNVTEYKEIPVCFLNEKSGDKKENSRFINKIKNIFGEEKFLRNEAEGLKKIVSDQKIEALICVIAPDFAAWITYGAKLRIPLILYQLDPFYNMGDVENKKLKQKFMKILPIFSKIYTTELLYENYMSDKDLRCYKDKTEIVQFPKLVEMLPSKKEKNVGKVRLLYGGTLYRRIRNPKILLELRKKLSENYEIMYLGKCDVEEDQRTLEESGIICKGYCSQEELKKEISDADILINIGNLVKNQLGSKLIEYIATGKPILNIYQFEKCPTLKVLEKYPYKCNIMVSDTTVNGDDILKVEKFIMESRGRTMSFSEIKELYQEYTPEYVAGVFAREICCKEYRNNLCK